MRSRWDRRRNGHSRLLAANEGVTVELTLSTRDVQGTGVIEVGGEVDVYTAPQLDAELTRLIDGDVFNIVVDLSGVDFLDSTGLGVLVKALQRTRENGGSLAVVATADRITKVFRITGLDSAMSLHSTVDDAVAL